MFDQNHRKIVFEKNSVKRFYGDQISLDRACFRRELIRDFDFVPNVLEVNKRGKYYEEERIYQKASINHRLKDIDIARLAIILKRLHTLKLTPIIKEKLADSYTQDIKYHPKKIFESIWSNMSYIYRRKYKKYLRLANELERLFQNIDDKLSLIHGDLRPGNIVFNQNNDIKIIDWDDCRLDLPLVDVFVFFSNYKLSVKQKTIFWRSYQKPKWYNREIKKYFTVTQEMWNYVQEPITVVIPTYNRCPCQRLSLNPLFVTVKSLLSESNNISEIIIGDDHSDDHTLATVELIRNKFPLVNITYFKNDSRLKASYTRRKAINLCKTSLFFMCDDDCIFPEKFIERTYDLFKDVSKIDRDVAVLGVPYANKLFKMKGAVPIENYLQPDYKNHWIYHNMDKLPIGVMEPYVKVGIFEGIFLARKDCFELAGNYEELTDFTIDYAEHVSMSRRIVNVGFSIYYAIGNKYLTTHLKYGDYDPKIDYSEVPDKYRGVIKRANIMRTSSGDRMKWQDTLKSLISSFTYFYFCISELEGRKHILKEMDFIIKNGDVSLELVSVYREGVNEALTALIKKGVISEREKYAQIANREITKVRKEYKLK